MHVIGNGTNEYETPTMRLSLRDILNDYNVKLAAIPSEVTDFTNAWKHAQSSACIGGTYGGPIHSGYIALSGNDMARVLLKSAWKHVYEGLQITSISSAKDRKKFDLLLTNPPSFTMEHIRDIFGDYLISPRWHILKGLAECFCELDPAYKSHSKVMIGVTGLPNRVIIANVNSFYGNGIDKVKDVISTLCAVRGTPCPDYAMLRDYVDGKIRTLCGITIKLFKNGNAHLIFDKIALRDINKALAEFYGEVLADSPEEQKTQSKQASTNISTDLAYYPTPHAVISRLLQDISIRPDMNILEPSCGDGRILSAILKDYPTISHTGIEVHGGRADMARRSGLNVLTANFLEVPVADKFDIVLMNPPFAGKHYQKHVEHAKKFLKPGGILKAILPASAYYDHDFCGNQTSGWNPCWQDLPVGSFRESGTSVPTGIFTYHIAR